MSDDVPVAHEECAEFLRQQMAKLGCEVTVSTAYPITTVVPHPPQPYRCPHGQEFWIQPTIGRVRQWIRDGVE